LSADARGAGTILFGGSGFLGPHILRTCPDMVSVGRTPPPTPNRHVPVESLADLGALEDVEFDKVIYIIGNTDHHALERERIPRDEPNAFDYHVIPLLQTLEQLKHRPVRKFIHFSTVLIYDDKRLTLPVSERSPIDPYKNRYVLSKYLAEEASKFYARWMPIVTVRLSNIYGPTPLERYDLIHVLIRTLLARGTAEVWSTRPERDFIYVEDVAEAVVQLLDADYTGTLNLGTGVMTPVARVVDILQKLSGGRISVKDVPVQGPMRFQCDMTTLSRIIEWKPRWSVEDGVRRTWEVMRSGHGA
jgi:nucleoside-diphosphate-sugar epimerase